MRKVILTSLGGKAYHLEEAASEQIGAYLEHAGRTLMGNPDRAEILADLEQAIADKCDSFLGKHRNVVTAEEATQVLRELGPVQGDASGDDVTAAFAGPRRRRLMRLPSEGMVGGVCAGFGAYFSLDVVWVRLAFVLFTVITGGTWILVWLAMLIVMPAARTPEQMACARGEALSAREVMEMARKKSSDLGKVAASAVRDAERNLRDTFGPRG
jgi:phage shock protein PspC (stress-responsive transcriptional regulator)